MRSEQLARGERTTLLRVEGVGRFVARCNDRGRSTISFSADALLATASVTVHADGRVRREILNPGQTVTAPAGRADLQTWQIAEFAKEETVSTVWVSVGRSPGAPFYACGASAHAIADVEQP